MSCARPNRYLAAHSLWLYSEPMLRRQIAGLLIIAAVILVLALFRADPHVLFPLPAGGGR